MRTPGRSRLLLSFALLLLAAGWAAGTRAAPDRTGTAAERRAAPDWMSAETAARLALGFDVLVPSWVPAPFAGEPAVSAGGGAYELYWMVEGGPPTYLDIVGTAGGDIPDYSLYDRNVQLELNADVGGYPAYRDLTPIYDLVYWQIGDVVYSVGSQGMTGTDSLALANALVVLEPVVPIDPGGGDPGGGDGGTGGEGGGDGGTTDPGDGGADPGAGVDPGPGAVGPEPEPGVEEESVPAEEGPTTGGEVPAAEVPPAAESEAGAENEAFEPGAVAGVAMAVPDEVDEGQTVEVVVEGVEDARLTAGGGRFAASGETEAEGVATGRHRWRAPEVASNTWVRIVLIDPGTQEWLAVGEVLVRAVRAADRYPGPWASSDGTDGPRTDRSWEADPPGAFAVGGTPPSDGTGGPPPPPAASDGTGGPSRAAPGETTPTPAPGASS